MSNPRLPPEIFDYIIDLLRNEPEGLRKCCLVSRSWVPRTRKHLFVNIKFLSVYDVQSWRKAFPNAWNSPMYHTLTLSVCCTRAIMEADARAGSLIRTFPRVEQLRLTQPTSGNTLLGTPGSMERIYFAPFHKFSSTLKSLHVGFTLLSSPQIFDLVRSFPLLEDLALSGCNQDYGPYELQTTGPSPSPTFTGSLDLDILGGMGDIARGLLDLPNGLRFRKLTLLWHHMEDLRWIMELVVRCSDTLESLNIKCRPPCNSSVDLSTATKLRDLVLRPGSLSVAWVIMALQTITSEHRELRHISIQVPYDFTFINADADVLQTVGEAISRQWFGLDRLLVQLWESRSIRPRVILAMKLWEGKIDTKYCVGCLLPEVTKEGIVDLVQPN